MKTTPHVSIIILNWNGYQETLLCLKSLQSLAYPSFDVTILDNGSHRNELPLLQGEMPRESRLLRMENNLGFAGGVNHCLRAILADQKSKTDYFLLLNNDVQVTADFLNLLVEAGQSEAKLGIIGPVVSETQTGRTDPITMGTIHWMTGKTTYAHAIPNDSLFVQCDLVHGCCLLMKREIVDQVGLLDEKYFAYYEETDLCVRAKRAGYVVAIVPSAIVYHEGSSSVNRVSGMQEFLMMRNRIWFVRKNGNFVQWISTVLFCALFYGPRRAARAVVYRNRDGLAAVVRGFVAGLGHRIKRFR